MTKVLDLDKLETGHEKNIVIKGVTHRMVPFTVRDFINSLKEAEKALKESESDEDNLEKSIEATMSVILKVFPTITKETLEELPMDSLSAIFQFIQSEAEEEAGKRAGK